MNPSDEAAELMQGVGGPRWTSGPVPENVAPLLKALADLARERGEGIHLKKLQEVVRVKTGQRKGLVVLHRWIEEAGGEPWFKV